MTWKPSPEPARYDRQRVAQLEPPPKRPRHLAGRIADLLHQCAHTHVVATCLATCVAWYVHKTTVRIYLPLA
jgi:hypothetical protein